jgi:hypothetical protein
MKDKDRRLRNEQGKGEMRKLEGVE